MYIIDHVSLDQTGRIVIRNYFEGSVPSMVGIAYEPKNREIIIKSYDPNDGFLPRKVDSKKRISVPKWLAAIMKNQTYLIRDEQGNRKILIFDSL